MSPSTECVAALVASVSAAKDDAARRAAFQHGFGRLRAELPLHPKGPTAAATFEAAADVACAVAEESLPLGTALVMHFYPLCALRSVPLPWFSSASFKRSHLMCAIDNHALMLANAGSERAIGAHTPVTITRTRDGIRVDGTYDYVSLANVADLVLFSAPLVDGKCDLFCAVDLRAESVKIGAAKFGGSMLLSDTCSMTFESHPVRTEQFIIVPTKSALSCMTQYQRSWFQLLLSESYLARVRRLQRQWDLPQSVEQLASLNELACLRAYALRLLNEASSLSAVESLLKVTTAMKLRVSWIGQSIAASLRSRDKDAANELGFFQLQPTSNERIQRGLFPKASRGDEYSAAGSEMVIARD